MILSSVKKYLINKLMAKGYSYAVAKAKVLSRRYNAYRNPRVMRNRFSVSRKNFPTTAVHTFSRKIQYSTGASGTKNVAVFATTSAVGNFGYEFSLDDCDIMGGAGSYTSALTSMYDQYRLLKATVTFVPRFTEATISATGVQLPRLYTIVDYDSASLSLTEDQILQYQNVKVVRGQRVHSRSIVPAMRQDAEGSVGAVTLKKKQWIDMANTSLTQFGIYVVVPKVLNQDNSTPGTAQTFYYDTYLTLTFQCKGLR